MAKVKMQTIDPKKLRAFMADKKAAEVAEALGKAPNYIKSVLTRGKMPINVYNLMRRLYDLPFDALLPDPPKPEPVPVPVQMEIAGDPIHEKRAKRAAYWIDLVDNENHIALNLMYNEEILFTSRAKVKNGKNARELDFIQAVSYAAHMLYKLAEQKELEAGEE